MLAGLSLARQEGSVRALLWQKAFFEIEGLALELAAACILDGEGPGDVGAALVGGGGAQAGGQGLACIECNRREGWEI